MINIIDTLSSYLQFSFVRYSLIVGTLIALCSSILGVILVLKRYSFIGDGLSHVAFGAVAIATVLRVNNSTIIVMPITILFAIILLSAKIYNKKTEGDSLLAMISVGSLAIGYFLLNIFPSGTNVSTDVCGTLFGSTSILTLTLTDVWVCTIVSLIVIVLFVIFYNKIFSVTYDESFAYASGINVGFYNSMISIICAVVVVLAMNLVGSLLISALIVFPAVSAMQIYKSFRGVIIATMLISVICALIGIIISLLLSTPVGATVVMVYIIAYIICSTIGRICK